MKLKNLFFIYAVILAGCSATGEKYRETVASDLHEKSELIIYREGKIGASGSTFCTKVDGGSVGILTNGGFLRKVVKPGKTIVTMPFDEGLTLEVDLVSGEKTYIEFTVGLAGMGVIPIGSITAVSMSWNMAMITRDSNYSLEKLSELRESTYSDDCIQ